MLVLLLLISSAAAMPYIALPAQQFALVDLSALHVRVPRQALEPPPAPYEQRLVPIQYQQQELALGPVAQPEAQARLIQRLQQDASQAASQGAAARLAERPPDFGEYVDFGAHTGDQGAFGWYADYPVNNHQEHSSYRK